MDKKNFAFDKNELHPAGCGYGGDYHRFPADDGTGALRKRLSSLIFSSVRRIKVAPLVCFLGFIFMIYGIRRKPKSIQDNDNRPE